MKIFGSVFGTFKLDIIQCFSIKSRKWYRGQVAAARIIGGPNEPDFPLTIMTFFSSCIRWIGTAEDMCGSNRTEQSHTSPLLIWESIVTNRGVILIQHSLFVGIFEVTQTIVRPLKSFQSPQTEYASGMRESIAGSFFFFAKQPRKILKNVFIQQKIFRKQTTLRFSFLSSYSWKTSGDLVLPFII